MKPKFYRKVLKSGFTILLEKRDLPVVSVAIAVRSGGTSEATNERGISHFIEHMLYKGTKNRSSKEIAEEVERRGGKLNGFTGEMITAFWCKMPSKHLGVALEVLSDLVQNPLFDEKEFNKERKVIFEEIKMFHDDPVAHSLEEVHKSLYEKPFGIPLIGTYEIMGAITREDLINKFKKIYAPNNMVLCVVGNADFQNLIKFAQKNFGDDKKTIPKLKIIPKTESRIEKRKGIDQANLFFAYHAPLAGDKKSYAAEVLNALMACGMSSRLWQEIREKRNLAYVVSGEAEINKDFAYNLIHVGTTKDAVEKVRDLVLEEFEKVSKTLSEKELREVKEQLIGNHQIAMEESVLQMTNLLVYEMNGHAKDFYDFEKNIKKVKLEDVKNLAKIKKYSFFALVPE